MFGVICPLFLVFAVKLASFLRFTVSEENTVKCLEGSSDIFGNGRTSSLVLGNFRQPSGIFGSLRKSSEIVRNCRKIAKNSLIYTLNKIILTSLEPFLFLSGKNLLFRRIFYC